MRRGGREIGLATMLPAIAGLSQEDLAAVLDTQRKHLQEMLAGVRPWSIECFVLIAQRRPDIAVRVARAYATLVPVRYIRQLIVMLTELADELERKEDSI